MTSILAISDMHGHLFNIDSKPVDLCLIAGDICPDHDIFDQLKWMNTDFRDWCSKIPAEKIIVIAGNHDYCLEEYPKNISWDERVTYLCNEITTHKNHRIWGLPYTPKYGYWAFMRSEDKILDMYRKMSLDYNILCGESDIFVAHGPPYGILDIGYDKEHAGSKSLLELMHWIKPKLVVNGHIHANNGTEKIQYFSKQGIVANVSVVDNRYQLCNKGTYLEIPE